MNGSTCSPENLASSSESANTCSLPARSRSSTPPSPIGSARRTPTTSRSCTSSGPGEIRRCIAPPTPDHALCADRGPCRAEVLAGLDHALGHPGLARLAPGARVVGLLVADLAVDLQYAVVVG